MRWAIPREELNGDEEMCNIGTMRASEEHVDLVFVLQGGIKMTRPCQSRAANMSPLVTERLPIYMYIMISPMTPVSPPVPQQELRKIRLTSPGDL
jgi:hypothetical protein